MANALNILRREITREAKQASETLESAWKRGWALTPDERAMVRVGLANRRAAIVAYCRLADGRPRGWAML